VGNAHGYYKKWIAVLAGIFALAKIMTKPDVRVEAIISRKIKAKL